MIIKKELRKKLIGALIADWEGDSAKLGLLIQSIVLNMNTSNDIKINYLLDLNKQFEECMLQLVEIDVYKKLIDKNNNNKADPEP